MGGSGTADVVVSFYRGDRPDAEGRFLAEIWAWDDEALEAVHDYIQWLFPLEEPSGVNPRAPLVSAAARAAFATDADLVARLGRSFERMLAFYGLERAPAADGGGIRPGPAFGVRRRVWLQPFNHNFLRLTRILTSLRILGRSADALSLFRCLEALYRGSDGPVIGARTFGFWRRAAEGRS